jgi:plasmid replication initiation protein
MGKSGWQTMDHCHPSLLARATEHDKDVLIYAISQLTADVDRSLPNAANQVIRFTAYDYFLATNCGVSSRDYANLKESLVRCAVRL